MVEQIFSDGIDSIVNIDGTVRIDFVAFSPNEEGANGQPKFVLLQRIVMGPEGFLRSVEKLQAAAQALSRRGNRTRPPGEPAEGAPAAQANAPSVVPIPPKYPFP